jgi:hypothetical protein
MVSSVELEIEADAVTSQPSGRSCGYYASHQARYASEG